MASSAEIVRRASFGFDALSPERPTWANQRGILKARTFRIGGFRIGGFHLLSWFVHVGRSSGNHELNAQSNQRRWRASEFHEGGADCRRDETARRTLSPARGPHRTALR